MQVMILPSVDGQYWTHAVLLDDDVDAEALRPQIEAAIQAGKLAGGEEWDSDDIDGELAKLPGVVMPSKTIHGPAWDEEIPIPGRG